MNTGVDGGGSEPTASIDRVDGTAKEPCGAEDTEARGQEDIERSRNGPGLIRTSYPDIPARVSHSLEQIAVDPPSSEWWIDEQNGDAIELPLVNSMTAHRVWPDVLSTRWVSHVTVIVLLGIALLLGRLSWGRWSSASAQPARTFKQRVLLFVPLEQVARTGFDGGFVRRRMPPSTVDTPDIPRELAEIGQGGSRFVDAGFVTRGIDPEGSLKPITRMDVVTYAVRYGDTLWDVAKKFSITQDTLWANNDLRSPDMLSVGDELVIPPIDGLIYTVRRGDTLEKLAKRYRADVEDIVNYAANGLSEGERLTVGQEIIIPGGVKPMPARRTVSLASAPRGALKGVGSFVMPVSGILTQGFHPGHSAIDIGAPRGTPVYAADSGYVTFAGWHPWGYGYAVEIDHGNGFRTLYAHLSWYAVDPGDSVKRGQRVGSVGSTYGSGGWSSGPHLHLEIIQNGAKRNPCVFLPCP